MRLCISILLTALIVGCGEEVIQKPENLIPPNKMAEILYDLALVNAAKSTNPGLLKDHNIEAMPYLYERHGIDSAQFVDSDTYYASKPMEYEAIYKQVEVRLEKEKNAMEEERKRVSDSIRIEAEKRREAAAAAEKSSDD